MDVCRQEPAAAAYTPVADPPVLFLVALASRAYVVLLTADTAAPDELKARVVFLHRTSWTAEATVGDTGCTRNSPPYFAAREVDPCLVNLLNVPISIVNQTWK